MELVNLIDVMFDVLGVVVKDDDDVYVYVVLVGISIGVGGYFVIECV